LIRRQNEQKGNILIERPARKQIQSAHVEAVRRDSLLTGWGLIHCDLVRAFTMPARCDAYGHGPISIVLPDRGVAVVHQLVTAVFELLSTIIEHWPSLVTGRTAQPVLARESRQGVGVVNKTNG